MPCYRVFDLNIQAEFLIPAFEGAQIEHAAEIDVTIRNGHVPEKLAEAKKTGVCYQLGRHMLQLNVPGIGRYIARKGQEIIVEPETEASFDAVHALLLDGPLTGIFHQRGMLPFYGGAVAVNDYAVMICGISGTGKSTLIRELIKKGYPFVSDDLAVVTGKEGILGMLPGYPFQRLPLDTLERNGLSPDQYPAVRPGINQRRVPVEKNAWTNHSLPLKKIVVLTTWNREGMESKVLESDTLKFNLLHDAMHRQYLSGMGTGFAQFKLTAGLMEKMPATQVIHPREPNKIDETLDLLVEVLAS